jgi:small subunit ribosomal protein S17e
VRGISLKLQEEERERRMDFVPAESAINPSSLTVDPDTKDMLNNLGMSALPVKVEDVKREEVRPQRFGGPRRDAPPGGGR